MFKIRKATSNDIEILAQALAKDEEYANWREADLLSYIERDNQNLLIIGEKPNGFLIYSDIFEEAEIIMLWIEPQFRNQRLGTHLLNEFLDLCRASNIKKVFLEVAQNNYSAIRLYEAHGFSNIGVRRAYYTKANGETIDAIIMQHSAH